MRVSLHRKLLVALLLTIAASDADAGNRSGTVSGQFLKLPVDARAGAMGNALVSLAQGASSIAYNPAGTLSIEGVAFGGTYQKWFADITHSFVGAAANLRDWGTVGLGVTMLMTDDMPVTTPAFPEGTGEFFKASDYAFTVSYARQISEQFALGLAAKYISSYLYNTEISSSSIAFDIGTLYDIPILRTRLGISLNNLGKDLQYINEQYSLPSALRFGSRTTILDGSGGHLLYAAFQISRPNDANEQYNIGAEYVFQNAIALRTGYRFNYDTEDWSGGAGVSLQSLGLEGGIDYSYTNYKYLPGTHMFSIAIGL